MSGLLTAAEAVEKAHEFTLVPWSPVIDRQLVREATGVVQGGTLF